jgi:hypothetical protein
MPVLKLAHDNPRPGTTPRKRSHLTVIPKERQSLVGVPMALEESRIFLTPAAQQGILHTEAWAACEELLPQPWRLYSEHMRSLATTGYVQLASWQAPYF